MRTDCSRLITTAARSPANWLPMKSQFLRPRRPGSHLVLNMVGVDRHGTVQQEPGQPRPVAQAVVDSLGNCAAVG